jgi:hypothetical protein
VTFLINEVIENIRKQLYEFAEIETLASEETLHLSNEMNKYLNYHTKLTHPGNWKEYTSPKVHANAVQNIISVCEKEKLDLSYFGTKIPKNNKWYKLSLVSSLLDYIAIKYGWDAVEYMGEFVPEKCIFPHSIVDFEQSLRYLNDIYHSNHKSIIYIGEYLPYHSSEKEYMMFCHTPHYPTTFNHGILKGLSKKFNHNAKIMLRNKEEGGQFKISL